jgi:hypothetical protein
LGGLAKLEVMDISHNPLVIPPPDVLNRGTPAVLAWLRKNEKTVRACYLCIGLHTMRSLILVLVTKHRREETSTSRVSRSSKPVVADDA